MWNVVSVKFRAHYCILPRAFNKRYASFSSEEDLVRLIMNYPTFGGGIAGFSNNLQGTPHAVVHNFIGQSMGTFFSPGLYDPAECIGSNLVDSLFVCCTLQTIPCSCCITVTSIVSGLYIKISIIRTVLMRNPCRRTVTLLGAA